MKTREIRFRAERDTDTELQRIAAARRESKSIIIREAIREYLEKHSGD